MKQKFYVVLYRGQVARQTEEGMLFSAKDRQAGTLFDDYDQARNAVRRDFRNARALGLKNARSSDYKIQRLVL